MRRARKNNGEPVLTAKERAFITAYTSGSSNALQAAIEAGYKSPAKESYQLLRRPHVVAEIERRQALMREGEDFDLKRLKEWTVFAATFDMSSIFKPGTWQMLPMDDWPDQRLRRLVEKVKVTKNKDGTVTVQVYFSPRNPNLDRIGQLMGVKKRISISTEETRSIPISLIDRLTDNADAIETRKADAGNGNGNGRITIEELDAINPNKPDKDKLN